MSGETLQTLIKFLPTILTLVIILLCMLRGLMRGFRKSLILFIQYLIGLTVGFICYLKVSKMLVTEEIGWLFSMIGGDFADAKTMYDFFEILIKDTLPKFAEAANHPYIYNIIMSLAGLGVSLVAGILCLVIIPLIVRWILYLIYLIFYREGKRKRHIRAEGDEYRPRRLLGMAVGAARGIICSFLFVSIVTTSFYLVSGGDTEGSDSDLLKSLEDTVGVDINAIYNGIIESRTTGVGLIYNKIVIKDQPIDLLYTKLFLKSSFTYKEYVPISQSIANLTDSIPGGEEVQFDLLDELKLLFDLANIVLESNVITVHDGAYVVDLELLEEVLTPEIEQYFLESEIFSDMVPFAIVGIAETIQTGEIELGGVEKLFTPEVVEKIKTIDFAGDISKLLSTALYAVELVPLANGSAIDKDALKDYNTYLNLDVETVKEVFNRLSEIDLLTEFLFPVGLGASLDLMNEKIEAAGMNVSAADFANIDWSFELKNLGNIFEKAIELELDINRLLDKEVNPETNVANNIEYILSLLTDETKSAEFKNNLSTLIDTVFDSDLLSIVALSYTKSSIAKLEFVTEDGETTPLNDAFDLVKANMDHYTVANLRNDLHTIVNSCLDATNLIPVFKNNGKDYFKMLYDIDAEDLRNSLFGRYNEATGLREGGIYSISLLNGNLDGISGVDSGCYYAIDPLIESALKTYGSQILSSDVVNSVTKGKTPTDANYDFNAWPNELNALVDGIEELQTVECLPDIKLELGEDDKITDILPETMTNEDIDTITEAASKSVLLSGLIEEKIVSTLASDPDFGYAVSDESIVWMDSFEDLTPEIEKEEDKTYFVHRGELNYLLKAFMIFSDEEKGIDLENTDSLINGLAQLIKEDTNANLDEKNPNVMNGLDYSEVITFAKSQVIMTVLSGEISKMSEDEENSNEEFQIIIPDKLKTTDTPENWKLWSHNGENNLDHKKGEFAKLVVVLYFAREYALTNPTVLDGEEANSYALNMDNLLNSVVYMNKDSYVTDSLVLYATTSDALMKQDGDDSSIIYIPERAKVEKSQNNNNIIIKKEEIDNLFTVIRELEVNLVGNSFEDVKLQTALDKIDESSVRESICLSSIFAASTINKITDNDEIKVPFEYKRKTINNEWVIDLNNDIWYPASSENWEESELNKMLIAVNELEITSTATEGSDEGDHLQIPKIDEIIDKLNRGDKLDNVYDSIIFRTTISSHLVGRSDIKFRQVAYKEEEFNVTEDSNLNIKKEEIKELVYFLNETNIKLEGGDGFDKEVIISSLEDPNIRECVVSSNILNITIVDLLAKSKDIAIPNKFMANGEVNLEAEWYLVNDDLNTSVDETIAWDESELGKILASVVELEITVENDQLVVKEITPLLKSLNQRSKTQVSEDPQEFISALDVVYSSEVLKETIKKNILAQEKRENQDNTGKNLWILDEAFEDNDRSKYFKKSEIKLLCDFFAAKKADGSEAQIDINNIKNKVVFELLAVKENREILTKSNILNVTVVDRFDSVKDLKFPEQYLLVADNPSTTENEQKINRYADEWYANDGKRWEDAELAKLLASVHELDLLSYVDPITDEIKIPASTSLIKNLNEDSLTSEATVAETKLSVVYSSDTLALTISDKITSSPQVVVRQVAYRNENGVYTNILEENEVSYLIDFINLSHIDLDSTTSSNDGEPLNAETIFNLLHDNTEIETGVTRGQKIREMLVKSNILNRTTVDKVAKGTDPTSEASLKFAEAYIKNGVIDDRTELWYPQSEDNYQDCELYHLLESLDDLQIVANGNDITLSIDKNIDTILDNLKTVGHEEESILDRVYKSDNIAMTISARLNVTKSDGYKLPLYTADGNDIYGLIEGRRSANDKIFAEFEVENLLMAINALNLKFHDENDPNYKFNFEDVFDKVTLDVLNKNIDTVLDSAIIHHVFSDTLIGLKQTDGANFKYIITDTTYLNKDVSTVVVNYVGATNEKYVDTKEIKLAVEILLSLGFTKVEDAQNVGLPQLKQYFGSDNKDRATLIAKVSESAIMSKIFSQVLIANNILTAVENMHNVSYDRVMVVETYTQLPVETLTREALAKFLADNSTWFDKLSV